MRRSFNWRRPCFFFKDLLVAVVVHLSVEACSTELIFCLTMAKRAFIHSYLLIRSFLTAKRINADKEVNPK